MRPRVSILIPNFDNGRDASCEAARGFLADLLRSLDTTLAEERVPFEVLVADDGSTDDSLAVARSWASRTWPDGRPFLRLLELEHTGILAAVLNRLMREAKGELFFRLDGDVLVHTPEWVSRICRVFDEGPEDLGIVGAKQLTPNGRVHCHGDWILHPRGYHHACQGEEPADVTRTIEVDDVMGCFHCMRRSVWETVGGYDESIRRGQTNDYSMMARRHGWRLWSVPDVVITHYHSQRGWRRNRADTAGDLDVALDRFRMKWGFDRLAPDLADVRRRWDGTPLLWNDRVWGAATAPRRLLPPPIEDSPWQALASTPDAQSRWMGHLASTVEALPPGTGDSSRPAGVVSFGADAGVLAHLLAQRGVPCTGVQVHPGDAALGTTITGRGRYPGPVPLVVPGERGSHGEERWPVESGRAAVVVLAECLEHHWNPVGVLREAHRALAADGTLLVRSAWRRTFTDVADLDPDVEPGVPHQYRAHELNAQIRHTRLFAIDAEAHEPPADGMLTLVARRAGVPAAHGHFAG